jgi:hypothetical protein
MVHAKNGAGRGKAFYEKCVQVSERSHVLQRRVAKAVVSIMALTAAAIPLRATAADVSPLAGFLLRPGEMTGFEPGKVQTFRTVAAIRGGSGQRPSMQELRRYEADGFLEAVSARIHNRGEPGAKGLSTVFEFETPAGAKAEMKAELNDEFNGIVPGPERDYFILSRFKVPNVLNAVAFAVVTNRAAETLGVESGVSKAMFVEGDCLFTLGVYRPASNEVTKPVVSGVQSISGRAGGACT